MWLRSDESPSPLALIDYMYSPRTHGESGCDAAGFCSSMRHFSWGQRLPCGRGTHEAEIKPILDEPMSFRFRLGFDHGVCAR